MGKVTNYYLPNYTVLMVGEAYSTLECDHVALLNYSPLVLVGLDDIHFTTPWLLNNLSNTAI